MPPSRARRSSLPAWLALGCAAAVWALGAAAGLHPARADDGATETALAAPPSEAPGNNAPTPSATPEAPTHPPAFTVPPSSETPASATPDPASATPEASASPALPNTHTPSPLASATATDGWSNGPTETPSATPAPATATPEPSSTPVPPTPEPSPTPTPLPSPTHPLTSSTAQTPAPLSAFPGAALINEVVTEPQTDWSGGGFGGSPGAGTISEADAYVELYFTASGLNLAGWTITLEDGTPFSGDLTSSGAFNVARYVGGGSPAYTLAGDYLVLGGPAGDLSNTVLVTLRDEEGTLIDRVQVGGGGAPSGDSTGPADESISRFPNAVDTGDDQGDFRQQAGTPGYANVPGPLPPTATPIANPPLAVVINEVAWAGTAASGSDEWLELYNPGSAAINLRDWTLTDGNDVALTFPVLVIPPGGYLLLERTSDATVSDILADLLYTGGLNDGGETLTLRDALGNVIDTANAGGGPWPAGDSAAHATMERRSPAADAPGNWQTHTNASQAGRDAGGSPLRGTARAANSGALPTATPLPGGINVLLNEFLPRPGAGGQEFIEVINLGGVVVDLSGWQLDDAPGGGGPYVFPPDTLIGPGALLFFDQALTGLALNDDGDTVRLLRPDTSTADSVSYGPARAGASWARLPDGGAWSDRGDPTPGLPNRALPAPYDPGVVPIGVLRGWPDGAWATVSAWVSVPPGVLGTRTIQVQDETGGITVYLGRDDWPSLRVGQPIRLELGYLRHQGGNLQLYVRNGWHVRTGTADALVPPAPWPLRTGVAARGNTYTGALASLLGVVTRLEDQALWLDDGTGPVRVFFPASAGVPRPPAVVGETWRVTGFIMEVSTEPRYRLQPRFASDLARVVDGVDVPYAVTVVPVVEAEPTATREP